MILLSPSNCDEGDSSSTSLCTSFNRPRVNSSADKSSNLRLRKDGLTDGERGDVDGDLIA